MTPLGVQWERIRRRWLMVLLVAALAVGASVGAVLLEPDSYSGRAALTNVSPDQDRDPEQDTVLTQGYADYFNQPSTQDAFRRSTGVPPTAVVTSRIAAGSPILYIEAEAGDEQTARDAATRMAVALRDVVNAGIAQGSASASDDDDDSGAGANNRLRDLQINAAVVANRPDVARTAFAWLVGGLLFGMLLAIARGRYENRILSPRYVRDRLGLDVLAVVTARGGRSRPTPSRDELLRSLMSLTDAHGMPRPGALAVTGPRTTRRSQTRVAVALAGLRARQGQTTLLVQADPGMLAPTEPAVRQPGALTEVEGVTDFLAEGVAGRLDGRVRSDGHGLLVCPPGTRRQEDPYTLFSKAQFHRLLGQGAALADLAVVDAPSADSEEGCVAAAAADRSLLVIEEGRTRARDAQVVLSALGHAGATALGVVLVRGGEMPDPDVLVDGPWHLTRVAAGPSSPSSTHTVSPGGRATAPVRTPGRES